MSEKQRGAIRVTCKAADALPLDALIDFQGDIKTLSEENAAKLRARIERDGINAPVFVWRSGGKASKHYILDGHQRVAVLRQMAIEGIEIPDIPVAYIDAKNRKDAASKLLAIASQYGQFVFSELEKWADEIDVTFDDIRLMGAEMTLEVPDFSISSEDEQGRLDKVGKQVVCPNCGHVIDE